MAGGCLDILEPPSRSATEYLAQYRSLTSFSTRGELDLTPKTGSHHTAGKCMSIKWLKR